MSCWVKHHVAVDPCQQELAKSAWPVQVVSVAGELCEEILAVVGVRAVIQGKWFIDG